MLRYKMSENSSNSSIGKSGNTKQISPSKHWCFTFNNYTQDDIKQFQKISSNSSNKYVFQEEIGEEGTRHLQGYIEFKEKLRPKNLFDNKIHWEKCRNIKKSILYCSKEDTRNGEIYCHNIRLPKKVKVLNENQLYPWQHDIIKIIKEEPDDRTINWFYEHDGCAGKSTFCKYLAVEHHALIVGARASDMKYMIVKYEELHGVYPDIIIMDIARSNNIDDIDYDGIEQVKNGLFMNSKYECCQVVMNNPHIICFANDKPLMCAMSTDRWNVVKI